LIDEDANISKPPRHEEIYEACVRRDLVSVHLKPYTSSPTFISNKTTFSPFSPAPYQNVNNSRAAPNPEASNAQSPFDDSSFKEFQPTPHNFLLLVPCKTYTSNLFK
jgi:hypothetical protein